MAASIKGINLHAIDFKAQKIQLSDSVCLDLQGIASVHRFTVEYSTLAKKHLFKEDEYSNTEKLTVAAITRRNNRLESCVFLHDSDKILERLTDEFMRAHSLVASSTCYAETDLFCENPIYNKKYAHAESGYNARRFVENIETVHTIPTKPLFQDDLAFLNYHPIAHRATPDECKARYTFLNFLLENGRKKRLDSAADEIHWEPDDRYEPSGYTYEIDSCLFSIPDDKKDYILHTESCLNCGNWDFKDLYRIICSFLPHNLKQKIELETEQLAETYGKGFAKEAEILENYRQSVRAQDFAEQYNSIQPEIDRWAKLTADGIAEKEFGQEYIALLQKKLKILEDALLLELQKYDFDPEKEEQCKETLLKRLDHIQAESDKQTELWYQEYLSREAWLCEVAINIPESLNHLKLQQYYEFYHYGSVLIGSRISRAEKYRMYQTGKSDALDDAMIYFYETATPKDAYRLEKRIENRKNGLPGEREVDHVLEWLEAGGSYRRVPKVWNKKDRADTIKLYNPAYIKYPQEYDQIIVGPQGIFVIETKYYAGTIKVDSNGSWRRIKKDGSLEGEKSPVQQVDRHVKLLRSFLPDGIPLIGVICISHPNAILEGAENCSVPLVKSDLLHEFIESYPPGNKLLSQEEIENCLSLIERHRCQEDEASDAK